MVSLHDLQRAVADYDSHALVCDLVFSGFIYSEKCDYYKFLITDVRRGNNYIVAFHRGKFVAVIDKS